MHLMMLAMPFGGGLSEFVSSEALAAPADSGDRPGGKKKGKGKDNDNDGVGPFKKKDYPLAERQRPLTLPANMGEVIPSLSVASGPDFDLDGDRDLLAGLGIGFKYGLANQVEVGIATGFPVAPDFDWNRTLTLQGHYLAYDSKQFDFAPGLTIPLVFADDFGLGVGIDLNSRYVLKGSKFFFRFGQNAINLGVTGDFSATISGNGGVGYQVSKEFVATLDTNVFSLAFAGGDAAFSGPWEYLTFGLGGQYTINRNADVGAVLSYGNFWELEEDFQLGVTGYGRIRF
jgi:hypothetical protein